MKRLIILILGAAIAGAGIVAHLRGWTGFERFSPVLWITVLVGVGIAVIGLLGNNASAKQIPKVYGRIAVIILNTLLLIWLLEVAMLVLVNTSTANIRAPQANLPYYANADSQRMWAEMQNTIGVNYEPFITWRRPAFNGEFVNVDERGLRVTPGAQCNSPDTYRVFMFGGSTVWGTGSPDAQTIPAYLQQGLSERIDGPVCVVNYGESAYVSTQETIALLLELQTGNFPDMVIFYDGANDVYAAYQTGEPNSHQNFYRFEEILNRSEDSGENAPFYFVRAIALAAADASPQTYATLGLETDAIAQGIVDAYTVNVQTVQGLAEQHDFEAVFFWQPVIADESKPLTDEEQAIFDAMDPALVDLYRATYAAARDAIDDGLETIYMADVFNETEAFTWIDLFHITPEGNEIVARHMLDEISGVLP
ncbi:MAG: SGNH/GDSL hydrolase family protein [Chloroflexota bacterium]